MINAESSNQSIHTISQRKHFTNRMLRQIIAGKTRQILFPESRRNSSHFTLVQKCNQLLGPESRINDKTIRCRLAAPQDIAVGLILAQHQTVYFHFAIDENPT